MRVEVTPSASGNDFYFRVRSAQPETRMYKWTKLEIETPDGERVRAWGDDSVTCYELTGKDPDEPEYGGFTVPAEPGTYTVFYDGKPVDEVRIDE